MKHFAQYYQDLFIDILGGKNKNGFFLDIGANDGVTFSNTYFFEKFRGWNGLCIEPQVDIFNKCASIRKCYLENVCISNKEGTVIFRKVSGLADMLSGIVDFMDEEAIGLIDKYCQSGTSSYEDVPIKSISINNLLSKYAVSKVDFCSIDVEGAEWSIMQTIDFNKTQICVFAIEGRDENIFSYLKEKGYTHVQSENDSFFLLKDCFTKIDYYKFRIVVWSYLLSQKIYRRIVNLKFGCVEK